MNGGGGGAAHTHTHTLQPTSCLSHSAPSEEPRAVGFSIVLRDFCLSAEEEEGQLFSVAHDQQAGREARRLISICKPSDSSGSRSSEMKMMHDLQIFMGTLRYCDAQ